MHLTHDLEADAVYIYLRPGAGVDRTVVLDDQRIVDYQGGTPVGIELLNVHTGVTVEGLPESAEVLRLLQQQSGITVTGVSDDGVLERVTGRHVG